MADTLATSHLAVTATTAGGAAKVAADRKDAKYAELARTYCFVPISCETLGPIHPHSLSFLRDLGRRIAAAMGDHRESAFLFQRLSIALQRFNSVCFKGSFIQATDPGGEPF